MVVLILRESMVEVVDLEQLVQMEIHRGIMNLVWVEHRMEVHS